MDNRIHKIIELKLSWRTGSRMSKSGDDVYKFTLHSKAN